MSRFFVITSALNGELIMTIKTISEIPGYLTAEYMPQLHAATSYNGQWRVMEKAIKAAVELAIESHEYHTQTKGRNLSSVG